MDYRILGPLEAKDGGRTVDLGTPKQRSLLALLVLHAGTSVSADRLADLLWDGAPPSRAEVSLRSYAANLRKVLGPDEVLASGPSGYRLVVADDAIDARRFEALVRNARAASAAGDRAAAIEKYGAALALWRGPALADVATNPLAASEAARLEEQRLTALEASFELRVEAGPSDAAELVPELERSVAQHPLREGLRASLLRALHAGGRTAEALAAYRDLQEQLADELGLDPSPRLRELAETIRAGTPTAGDAGALDRPALPGRDHELGVLRAARAAAGAGHGRMVVLEGDPGIGKTRLVTEVLREAKAEGWVVATAVCVATGDAPAFWPWAEILRAVDAALPLAPFVDARTADVLELVPSIDHGETAGPRPAALAPDAARFQRYDAVTTILTSAAATCPIAVLLDDLQWADPASLRLLVFLAGRLATAPLLVAVTLRSDEADGPEVGSVLAELARSSSVTRLPVAGLDDDAVATLAAGASPEVVAAIVDRAGGNPFFVTELLRLGTDELFAEAVPVAVRDVVRQRLQRLSPAAQKVLTVAAVVGREFDGRIVASVAGDDTDDALEAAVDAHILEERGPPGRYRFPHALVHEALADGISGLRRSRMHASIARALDARPRGDDDVRVSELARHLCAGAPTDPALAARAVDVTLEAGDRAIRRLGYESAAALYERALAAVDAGAVVDERHHAGLLVALATARRAAGDPASSREACLAAAELAQKAEDGDLLAAAALGLALPGAVIGMDFGVLDERRIELLQRALDLLGDDDSATRARVLAHLALALYLSPDRPRRDQVAAEAVEVARRLGDPGLLAAALAARRSTLWGPVSLLERLAVTQELISSAEQGGADQTALEGHIALAIDALEAADLDRFGVEITLIDGRATALRQPFYAWYARALEATRASLEARFGDAARLATAAREVGGVALGRRALWGQIGWQFVTSWDAGGLVDVEPALRALHSAFPDNVLVQGALGLVLAETGHIDDAVAVVSALLADPASTIPEDATWSFSLTLLAEVAWIAADGDAGGRIADLLAPASGRLVLAGSGVACCGAADRARGVGLLAAGRLDEAEPLLIDALALHRRIAAPAWAARTEGALAGLLQARGDDAMASVRLADARRGAADVGALGLLASLERLGRG